MHSAETVKVDLVVNVVKDGVLVVDKHLMTIPIILYHDYTVITTGELGV